jgi:hypothetical protein
VLQPALFPHLEVAGVFKIAEHVDNVVNLDWCYTPVKQFDQRGLDLHPVVVVVRKRRLKIFQRFLPKTSQLLQDHALAVVSEPRKLILLKTRF